MPKPSPTLRTPKTEDKYLKITESRKNSKFCSLCKEKKILKYFKHWKIIKNNFPYDKIAKTHHMILPFRHVRGKELSKKELEEFKNIKKSYINNGKYHFIMEATKKYKTIPDHFHLHLITLK